MLRRMSSSLWSRLWGLSNQSTASARLKTHPNELGNLYLPRMDSGQILCGRPARQLIWDIVSDWADRYRVRFVSIEVGQLKSKFAPVDIRRIGSLAETLWTSYYRPPRFPIAARTMTTLSGIQVASIRTVPRLSGVRLPGLWFAFKV